MSGRSPPPRVTKPTSFQQVISRKDRGIFHTTQTMAEPGYAACLNAAAGSPVTAGSPQMTVVGTASPPTPQGAALIGTLPTPGNLGQPNPGVYGSGAAPSPQARALSNGPTDRSNVQFEAEGGRPDGNFARASREYGGTNVETTVVGGSERERSPTGRRSASRATSMSERHQEETRLTPRRRQVSRAPPVTPRPARPIPLAPLDPNVGQQAAI